MRWLKKRSQPNEKLYYAWGFVRRLQIDHGNAFFGISHYHFRLRKKSENKKCKILDKRANNVQKYHPKLWFYLDFAYSTCKHVQNTKDFALILGRVGDILCLCTLKDRLSRILHFFFRIFSCAENDSGRCRKTHSRGLFEDDAQNAKHS